MKFKKIYNAMGLQCTQQQNHSIESICDAMMDLHKAYPNAGAQEMVSLLFHEKDMSVKVFDLNVVILYFAAFEVELATGVNNLFTVDQHNKWLHFSLALHTGIELFSVWHLNQNPQLILMYYLDTIEKLDILMITQSDPGSENYGIANAHTMLHQMYDVSLQDTLQYWWIHTKKNVTPKITWSQLHYRYQDHINNTVKRHDHNKVLPHGIPNLIYESPEDFGALDFKVTIDQDTIDHV
ncbi:uncharacterized protein BJ212DRAFT_1444466 [Suillus subaureus]|uniref:Uncharacterized protein n=1 Tax=Suillus subaureus TaxID=48587 RepID=A0A9P7ELN3_9AGAM|nr:uncharacterized protein BJ212DRAFT_1444466 [Suillus subaureus]KAG1824777.1 hypothetical protein BJ212DRAFT_1444466 [Suillus subaureus]